MPHRNDLPRRVLVADDEPDICRQLREALEAGGWEVHDANDGDAASKAVADLHPTVVVLDLRMPKADGLVVHKQIKEERPWTPVIILTGHGDEDDAIECCNQHAFCFLRKPVSPIEIANICERALDSYPDSVVAFFSWFHSVPDPSQVVYRTASGQLISAQQLMEEVQRQSPQGREFIREVARVAAELVVRGL